MPTAWCDGRRLVLKCCFRAPCTLPLQATLLLPFPRRTALCHAMPSNWIPSMKNALEKSRKTALKLWIAQCRQIVGPPREHRIWLFFCHVTATSWSHLHESRTHCNVVRQKSFWRQSSSELSLDAQRPMRAFFSTFFCRRVLAFAYAYAWLSLASRDMI